MMPRKKHHDIGAKCSVLMEYLHQAKRVSDLYPNWISQERFNAVEASKETICVNWKELMCIVMTHPLQPDNWFHSAVRFVKVENEWESCDFFDDGARVNAA